VEGLSKKNCGTKENETWKWTGTGPEMETEVEVVREIFVMKGIRVYEQIMGVREYLAYLGA